MKPALGGSVPSISIVLAGLLAALTAAQAAAQSVTLTAPTSTQTVKEGDDFFLTVMNNRLDFNERRDFMWEEGFSEGSISATSGIWTGTGDTTGPYVFPLFPGFTDTVASGPYAGVQVYTGVNTGLVGGRFPADGNKYLVLSARRQVSSVTNRSLYWGHNVTFPTSPVISQIDGYFTPDGSVLNAPNTWLLDFYDFRNSDVDGDGNPDTSQAADWKSSPLKAIRLDPSVSGASGTTVSYDWVRLSDPTSTTQLTITWTTSGIPATACTIVQPQKAHIFVDDDANLANGALRIARVNFNANTYTFPLSALPSGTWRFFVQVWRNCRDVGGTDQIIATSAYSGAVTINAATKVTIDSPSRTSGPDYATDMVQNPWDFSDTADVANLNPPVLDNQRQFSNPTFTEGVFTATANLPLPGNPHTDAQVWFNISPSMPILTKKFRYLTYTYGIDPSPFTDIADKVEFGWVARSVWWNASIQADGTSAVAETAYEGNLPGPPPAGSVPRRAYTMDLFPIDRNGDGRDDIPSYDDPFPKQSGWRGNETIAFMRFDPQETSRAPTNFSIDDIKLRAKPEPDMNNNFEIKVTTTDETNDPATIQVFRDNDAAGFNGTLLGTFTNVTPGTYTMNINTNSAGLFPGDYWIYAIVTDSAANVTRVYSDAPLHVLPKVWHQFFAVDPIETPFVGDFNGDGLSDIITFTRENPNAFGDVYVSLNKGGFFENPAQKWSDFFAINQNEKVVIGDFDGDGKDDILTWLAASTRQVYVARSFGNAMQLPAPVWLDSIGSSTSDVITAGDVNGDGKDDVIHFARTEGKVYVAISDGTRFGAVQQWHPFFAVSTFERPFAGDFDGDGKADIATFATDSPTAFGDVYISLNKGTFFENPAQKWHDFFAIAPTEQIVIADMNNDNKDDILTFLPFPFGQAYVTYSQGNQLSQPGVLWLTEDAVMSSSDLPSAGDFNNDGKADVILFERKPDLRLDTKKGTAGHARVVLTP